MAGVSQEYTIQDAGDEKRILFHDALSLQNVERIARPVDEYVSHVPEKSRIVIDLSDLKTMDTVGSGLISTLNRKALARHVDFRIENANADVRRVLDRFLWLDTPQKKEKTFLDWMESNGESILKAKDRFVEFLQLVADTLIFSIVEDKRTRRVRKGGCVAGGEPDWHWRDGNRLPFVVADWARRDVADGVAFAHVWCRYSRGRYDWHFDGARARSADDGDNHGWAQWCVDCRRNSHDVD